MSHATRRKIAYWFMLFFGISLLCLQITKYYENTLTLTPGEFIVSMLAIVLIINPLFILDGLRKYINSKTNAKDE